MWNLSRADDLVKLVKSLTSISELKSLQKYLLDDNNTRLLRDSNVYRALQEIPGQIYKICKEYPEKALAALIDLL